MRSPDLARAGGGTRPLPRLRTIRRAAGLLLAAFLAVALVTYARDMLQPSNVGLGARSVEWLRDHGGAWLVNDVEKVWYSLHAPKKGGPALRALPSTGLRAGAPPAVPLPGHRTAVASSYRPPRIRALIHPRLPGEGVWRPAGPPVAGGPPVLVTDFRPDPTYPQMVAGVAWIDHTRTRLELYPGRYEPPSASYRGPMEVPAVARGGLVATFNSGFKLEDEHGGFIANGRVDAPLVDGQATLLGYRSGRVDVRTWHGGPRGGRGIVFARQNLPLILDHGRLNPALSDGALWGATLGNAVRVWRSGVGVNRHGDLIYAAADQQTAASLAEILRHAGAVRAMELDINYEWMSFNTYAHWGARGAAKLLPTIDRPADRYLTPDDRDFFAVYRRRGP